MEDTMTKKSKLILFAVFYPCVVTVLHVVISETFRLAFTFSFQGYSMMHMLLFALRNVVFYICDYIIGFSCLKLILESEDGFKRYFTKRNILTIIAVSAGVHLIMGIISTAISIFYRTLYDYDTLSSGFPVILFFDSAIRAIPYLFAAIFIYKRTFLLEDGIKNVFVKLSGGVNGIAMYVVAILGIAYISFGSIIQFVNLMSFMEEPNSLYSFIDILAPARLPGSLFGFITYAVFLSIGIYHIRLDDKEA
jgi:hypothetical protein